MHKHAHHNCDENLGGKIIIHARTHLQVHEFSGIQNARRLSRGGVAMGDKKLLTITDDLKTISDLTAKPKIVPHSCRLFFPLKMKKKNTYIVIYLPTLLFSTVETITLGTIIFWYFY